MGDILLKIGFSKIQTEESMYSKKSASGKCLAVVLIYVDDILTSAKKKGRRNIVFQKDSTRSYDRGPKFPKSSIAPGQPLSLRDLQDLDEGKYPLLGEQRH